MKLVVIFNPVPQSSKGAGFDEFIDWKAVEAGLNRVRERYADVVFADIDYWPDDRFSVFSHVGTLFARDNSHRVGRLLKSIIGDDLPMPRHQAAQAAKLPRPVVIDFDRPYCGYGWTDRAGATNGFPLRFIGSRGKAWVWTGLGPGTGYVLRSVFRASNPGLSQHLVLKANGTGLRQLTTGSSGEDLYAEHFLPEAVVNGFGGWTELEIDFGESGLVAGQDKRTVSFQRITAEPAVVR